MPSAWGNAWGQAWGSAWGVIIATPILTEQIPDISAAAESGSHTHDLAAYFTGADSFAIAPPVEAGWSFDTTTGVLTIDTNDDGSFGPFVVTATNTNGDTASNAFDVVVVMIEDEGRLEFEMRLDLENVCEGDFYHFPQALKDPGETLLIALNCFRMCASIWRRNEQYDLDQCVRPSRPTGYAYKNKTPGGTSGAREPVFPLAIGSIYRGDGSIDWECVAAAGNGVTPILSPTATADSGLTVSGVATVESVKILAAYTGGTDGASYDAEYRFTLGGAPRVARQRVHVRKR